MALNINFQDIAAFATAFQGVNIARSGAQSQINSIYTGAEIAAQGQLMNAAALRSSINTVNQSLNFNLGVDAMNSQRRLSSMSRQFERTIGRQLSQQATTGLSLTSKSFLMVQNETRSHFEQEMLNFKIDAENQRRSKMFDAEVRKTNLENQARAAEYNAASQRVLASNRAASVRYASNQSTAGALSKATGSLLSGILGG